ncbi:acetylcholinesterase-like [Aricia agestis]|uniref:acetylcholinesterase-like n=1 Tax=Aricia agestis TaxID=91739 RepID=UPI001C20682B|nr:acetylcholinesterase-like [Aricia agestis]
MVHTPLGRIRGVPADDGDYAMFLGIPYAKLNASNPFGATTPHEKFDKVFEAFSESEICPQIREVQGSTDAPYGGGLDCLTLNVYVPNTRTGDRAVYIFMFGGQFTRGRSDRSYYGPRYLVRHDVIVVTFNYRLGPYGFMCTHIPEVPGNQGLRDQRDAIGWVRDNIRAFGGDPQRITIGGHSSGAMTVDMHILTERPRLFQQAIVQSGTATYSGFLGPTDKMSLTNIARDLGFETNDTYAALSFLASASPETVIRATINKYQWKPCIEDEFERVESFISENPELSAGSNVDGLKRQLRKYAKHRDTSVYMYMFSYDGRRNRMKRFYNISQAGATHSDELGYIFTMDFIPDEPNSEDQSKIDQITTLWTNFIKYGNPTPERSALLPVSWTPLTGDTVPCLQIGTNLTPISRPFHQRMTFWDLFFDTYFDTCPVIIELQERGPQMRAFFTSSS